MTEPAPLPTPEALSAIRAEIDQIDLGILALVAQRSACVDRLSKLKTPDGSPMRPAREVALLRKLLAAAPAGLEPELVVELWRVLIGASLRRQGTLEAVMPGGPDAPRLLDLARGHLGGGAKVHRVDDARAALTRALEVQGCVAVLPWPGATGAGSWWPVINETKFKPLAIVAGLPWTPDAGAEPEAALVAAGVPLEPARGDHSLAVAYDPHHRVSRALNEAKLTGREIARAREVVLLRIEDFIGPDDARVAALSRAGLDGFRVIGAFARLKALDV